MVCTGSMPFDDPPARRNGLLSRNPARSASASACRRCCYRLGDRQQDAEAGFDRTQMVSGAKDRGFAPVFFQKLQMGAESSLFAPVISPERPLTVPDGLKNVPLEAFKADIAPNVPLFVPLGAQATEAEPVWCLKNCGRPRPHEREGPAAKRWEGWSEAEVFQTPYP